MYNYFLLHCTVNSEEDEDEDGDDDDDEDEENEEDEDDEEASGDEVKPHTQYTHCSPV